MEEGTKSKKTVFVGGVGEDVDEAIIYENFSTFGALCLLPEYSYSTIILQGI